MSLQLLAKQMEAKGRGGDSVLVHMTPGEVEGLQKLAEAAGGTLTVNPETGLVEANFLKKVLNSRILPTLAGVAAGAVGGPMAGAAAGALVGGLQAKESDQNVLLGAGLGALGGYGGAGIGAGLGAAGSTAAQAGAMSNVANTTVANTAANVAPAAVMPSGFVGAGAEGIAGEAVAQNAANEALMQEAKATAIEQARMKAAEEYAAKSFAARTGEGIQALAGKPGRDAFLGEVGMKELGMAAAPMMLPEARDQSETPTDDERYVYDFDYGRTGAERTPVASTAERTYFQPTYRRVFSAAEGGEVADSAPADAGIAGGMSGASKAAFDYLMGNATSSAPQGIAAPAMTQTATPEMLAARSDREYIFNPATGQFIKNSAYGTGLNDIFVNSAGTDYYKSSGNVEDSNPEWSGMSDQKKAAYYAANPTMSAITQTGQRALEAITPGWLAAAREAVAPGASERQKAIARGDYSSGFAVGSDGSPASGYGKDSWSGNMSNYAGSGIDRGDRGEAAGGLITLAEGGLMGLAKGGMKSGGFVIPADVVSMIGEGNTDAGYKRIKSMVPGATAIKGKDGGQADTVKTSIDGKQPARVAHGEMYVPPETVKRMGGAKKLYAMMDRVRQQATGSKKQIKPVNLRRAMA